jgi:hypothetical protein
MARNVMLRRWFGTDYEEIHPITKAKNVFATNDKSMEEMVRDRLSYGVASGSASALTVTLNPVPVDLEAGFRLTIKVNNGGSGQTLNVNGIGAKAVKKANGSPAAMVAGGVYSLVYDGTAFILQGEGGGEGTAVAGDIRAGKTAETSAGAVTGTLAVRTGGNVTPGQSAITKAAGIYDTDIVVAAVPVPANKVLSDTTIAGVVGSVPIITSGEDPPQGVGKWGDGSLAVYPREGYRKGGSGAGEIKVTPALLQSVEGDMQAANIRNGVEIFGITGSLVDRREARGSLYIDANGYGQVTGLSFTPSFICYHGTNVESGIGYKDAYIGADMYLRYPGMWQNYTITIIAGGFTVQGGVAGSEQIVKSGYYSYYAIGTV